MGEIRRQSIASSLLIYIGFAFGALNIYLMVRQNLFTPEQKGLIDAITALNLVFFSFANIGATAIMSRFYPMYHKWQQDHENDLLSLALLFGTIGCIITILGAWLMQPLFVRKFSSNAPDLVKYYFWILPYTFFYFLFIILETQAGINKKTILANFLKETGSRIIVTLLIVLFATSIIDYDLFVKLFVFSYALSVIALAIYLKKIGKLHVSFKFSTLTRRLKNRMFQLAGYIFFGNLIFNIAQNIDSITITSQLGTALTAVYMLSKYISSIISVPMRSMVSIAVPYLSQAWKQKNYPEIQRIYSRSAINLFIIALFIFLNIWLNISNAYGLLHIDKAYEAGKWLVFILGIGMIVDMSTGINSHMLYVSPIWRFEFWSGIGVFLVAIPLNYFMVKSYGLFGAAIIHLFVMIVYNTIRVWYIYYRYKMQPFSKNTWMALLLAVVCYSISWLFGHQWGGWLGMFLRSALFSGLFITGIIQLQLTPDLEPIWEQIKKRWRK